MYKIPQYLHRPNQILWFETDEALLILLSIVLWFAAGKIFGVMGIVGLYLYIKAKKKYPRGFFTHFPMILGAEDMPVFGTIFIRKYFE